MNIAEYLDDSSKFDEIVHRAAMVVGGTEAAGFVVDNDNGSEVRLAVHLRPDESDEKIRAKAVRAFQQLIEPCVKQKKRGAIDLGKTHRPVGNTFCLIDLLFDEKRLVRGVVAVIAVCDDFAEAKAELIAMTENRPCQFDGL